MAFFEELAAEYTDLARHQYHLSYVLATCPAEQFRDPRRAVSLAKRALQLSPNSTRLYNALARAQMAAGDYEGAIETFQTAASIAGAEHPTHLRFALALAYWHAGDRQRGRQLYDEVVLELEDKPSGLWYAIEYQVLRADLEQAMGIKKQESQEEGGSEEQRPDDDKQANDEEQVAP